MDTEISLKALLSDDQRRDPYAYYAQLHKHGEAGPLDAAHDGYDVIVYGYDAVDRVLKDTTFLLMDAEYLDASSTHWRDHPTLQILRDSMFFANGDTHSRMRHVFTSVFTPRRVTALEPVITTLTGELLDRLDELGGGGEPVDFMAEFAFPLPSNVIGELLGVPVQDRAWFRPRVRAISEIFELDGSTWTNMQHADEAAEALLDYFTSLAARRAIDPDDDLLSGLMAARASGEGVLSDPELLANLIALFNAGFVTTTHLFGSGLAVLLTRPEELAALRAEASLAPSYVEEMLRYAPPTHFLIRYAAADTEIAGVPVAKGSSVVVALGAANRDPRRFADPDVFDPQRVDNRPLTFGAGPHFCLGAALTRAEGQLAFPMLLDRFPALALAGPLERPKRLQFRGFDDLQVLVR